MHFNKKTNVKVWVEQHDEIEGRENQNWTNVHVYMRLHFVCISFVEDGDFICCISNMGVGGRYSIPPHIDKITDIQSHAEFVILVEKEAA